MEILASDTSAATSAVQTVDVAERHVLTLISSANDPLVAIEIGNDKTPQDFAHHDFLGDLTGIRRTAELFGPLTYRVRRPAGHGACSVWATN